MLRMWLSSFCTVPPSPPPLASAPQHRLLLQEMLLECSKMARGSDCSDLLVAEVVRLLLVAATCLYDCMTRIV